MPIDTSIILKNTMPDLGQVLLRNLQREQISQQMAQEQALQPYKQQLLQTQIENAPLETQIKQLGLESSQQKLLQLQQQSALMNDAIIASKLKPAIDNQDKTLFKKTLAGTNLSPDQQDYYTLLADAGRWDQLDNIAVGTIDTAAQAGVYGSTSGGYKSVAAQALKTISDADKALASGKIDQTTRDAIVNMATKTQLSEIGGVPVTITGGRAKAVQLSDQIDSGSAATTDQGLPPPIPGGAPSTTPTTMQGLANFISTVKAQKAAAETYAGKEATTMAENVNLVNTGIQTRAATTSAFKDFGIDKFLKDVPEGKFASAMNNFVSNFMGGTTGRDAEARLGQLTSMMLQGVPFDPGSQSVAELEARKAVLGSLQDPNISVKEKIASINRYYQFIDTKTLETKKVVKDYFDRNPNIQKPLFLRESAGPATQMNAPTGQSIYKVDF